MQPTVRTTGTVTIGLQIRAALHTGEVELVPEDVRGVAVHVASRIMDEARPGEVLVSGVVTRAVSAQGDRRRA